MEFETTAKALEEAASTTVAAAPSSSPLAAPPTKSIESELATTTNDGMCDESKCISNGKSEFGSFTCYGEENSEGGISYHMTCADGFLPKFVEDEAPISWTGVDDYGNDALVRLRYFTCCPPDDQQADINPRRQCSDPIAQGPEGDDNAATCENNDTRRFPRQMKPRGAYIFYDAIGTLTDSFICCDSELPAAAEPMQFLDDAECVPYCDEFYKECKLRNTFGYVPERLCNVPEGGFNFPRPVGDDIYRWQCCKTGPALPPYIQDTTFKIEVSLLLILFCLGAIASLLVAVGLLIPLLMQLKDGSYYTIPSRRRSIGVVNARRRTSSGSIVGRHSSTVTPGVRESVRRELQEGVRYSTYNLYLAYLALPDLAYCLFRIRRVALHFNQGQIAGANVFWAMSLNVLVGNIWLNAIVCFEIMLLLRRSQRGEFIDPPSLTRVNLQALSVLILVITSFCLVWFFWNQIAEATADGDTEKSQFYNTLFVAWSFLVAIPPIVYVIYVNIVVWCCRGYMPSRSVLSSFNDKRTRALAVYFLRIVGIFFGVWIPAITCTALSDFSGISWTLFVAAALAATQPIATAAAILYKPDARRHILDLLTMSYFSKQETMRQTAVISSLAESSQESFHSFRNSNWVQSVNNSSSEETQLKPCTKEVDFISDREENSTSGSFNSIPSSENSELAQSVQANKSISEQSLACPSTTIIEFASDREDNCSVVDLVYGNSDDDSPDDDIDASISVISSESFELNP